MRPVSARLRDIVSSSHSARTRVSLVTGFPQTVDPSRTRLVVEDGDVKMDASATVRATVDVTVAAPWLSVAPDGGEELFVEYGVEVAGGSVEWVSLGYFRIDDVDQERLGGPLRISGTDRMGQVIDTEAVYPWVAPADISHAQFFRFLLYGKPDGAWFHPNAGVFPAGAAGQSIVFDYEAEATRIPYEIPLDKPFHELMSRVAADLDKVIFFDYLGRLNVVSGDVDPTTSVPVAELKAGPGGVIKGMSRQLTRMGVYNSVRTEGSQPTEGVPPWGYFVSPLGIEPPVGGGWYGPFGRVLKKVSSPLLTTGDECLTAAVAHYGRVKGLPQSASLRCVPNPALEPLDVIAVTVPGAGPSSSTTPPRPTMQYARTERHVIESLSFPLAGGEMTMTTRAPAVRS